MSIKSDLIEVDKFLSSPDKWTTGTYARDANGRTLITPWTENVTSCCLAGAVIRISRGDGDRSRPILNYLNDRLSRLQNRFGVSDFNDSSSFEDVKNFLKSAIEEAP